MSHSGDRMGEPYNHHRGGTRGRRLVKRANIESLLIGPHPFPSVITLRQVPEDVVGVVGVPADDLGVPDVPLATDSGSALDSGSETGPTSPECPGSPVRSGSSGHRGPVSDVGPSDDLTLSIVIGPTEASSIAAAVEGGKEERPLTHLFTADVVKSMGGAVSRVVIDRVEGPVYYCTVYLRLASGMFTRVDARPSDAIALAVRTGAPIFIADDVLEAAGTPRSFNEGPFDKRIEVEEFDKFIEKVDPEDFVTYGQK